eukprot:gb/GECH01013615.1/.p1 GENE.gb/GECH01013615.1/~~gb/GECH01013615.1/.p1  ORF type:complete len:1163 (+),score=259.89 gb/GECH01013615.1/:1-3489(+)
MFLDWISFAGLLQHDEAKNILAQWPLEVRQTVVAAVVRYQVEKYESATKLLTTPSHVKWVMECVGQAFQLPVGDNAEVIDLAIQLYRKWLFDSVKPAPIVKDTKYFQEEIFRHFSLLFDATQTKSPSALKNHIVLCNKVLAVFLEVGSAGHDLIQDEETWHVLLKVLIGITCSTILAKRGLNELNYGLLKVLFEVWLRSQIIDSDMWNTLQKFGFDLSKNIATIRQWNAVCIGLTNRVIRLLYGPTEGTQVVRINWKGLDKSEETRNELVSRDATELKFPDEYVFFAWEFMLRIVGNPNKLLDPETHAESFKGLAQIARTIGSVGSTVVSVPKGQERPKIPYATDGETILNMLGPWFFEAVNSSSNSAFNEGRAVAFSALCKIFCRRGGNPISRENLSRFYRALMSGLQEDDMTVLRHILMDSSRIFVYELEGSHILMSSYLKVLKKLLTVESLSNPYPDNLRSACITILSSLMCIPNNFLQEDNAFYANLKKEAEDILKRALQCERHTKNLQHLLWTVSVYVYEEVHADNPEVIAPFIKSIARLIKSGSNERSVYSSEVFVTALSVLSSLTKFYQEIDKQEPTLIPGLVEELSSFIMLQMNLFRNNKINPENASQLVSEAFYCICDWSMCNYKSIFNTQQRVKLILSAIEIGNNADKFTKKNCERQLTEIKMAAEFLLCHILNHVAHYPASKNTVNTSSHITENDETATIDGLTADESRYARFFMFDDMVILSVVEQPDSKKGPGVTVIVRDISGKYAWDSSLLMDEPETPTTLPDENPHLGATNSGITGNTAQAEENETMMTNAQPKDIFKRPGIDTFQNLIEEQNNIDTKQEDGNKDTMGQIDIRSEPPQLKDKYQLECKFQMSRLLLSHLGFLKFKPEAPEEHSEGTSTSSGPSSSNEMYRRLVPLQSGPKLIRNLKILDMSHQRECHKVAVVYVGNGQDKQEEILQNSAASSSFDKFVEAVGWPVDLSKHSDFMGGLDKNMSTGSRAPYYADYKTEVMFHVPTMMPTKKGEDQQIHKKRHVGNDHVNVVWSEHTREYRRSTISSQFNHVNIVIYPLECGLFRIQVFKKDEAIPPFGPLYDGMMVSRPILGDLVRMTAINANRTVRYMQPAYNRPFIARKALISEVAERYKDNMHPAIHMASLFSPKKVVKGGARKKK